MWVPRDLPDQQTASAACSLGISQSNAYMLPHDDTVKKPDHPTLDLGSLVTPHFEKLPCVSMHQASQISDLVFQASFKLLDDKTPTKDWVKSPDLDPTLLEPPGPLAPRATDTPNPES